MAREHDDDFQGSFFALEIDGLTLGYFTACSGIGIEFEVINFKEGNGSKVVARKRAGRPKYSEIVMKRGFTEDKALHTWFKEVVDAKDATPYKTASIVVFDRTQEEVARFNFDKCWPSKLSVSDLNAANDEVMIEEVTIQHETLDWV